MCILLGFLRFLRGDIKVNAKGAGVFIACILSERTEKRNKISFKIACENGS